MGCGCGYIYISVTEGLRSKEGVEVGSVFCLDTTKERDVESERGRAGFILVGGKWVSKC